MKWERASAMCGRLDTGEIIVAGGRYIPSQGSIYLSLPSVEIYNPISNSWRYTEYLPDTWHSGNMVDYNGSPIVVGGKTPSSVAGIETAEEKILQFIDGKWKELDKSLKYPRYDSVVVLAPRTLLPKCNEKRSLGQSYNYR